jgi:hypothetical protein
MHTEVKVIVSERFKDGVSIGFATGEDFYFTADLLWELRHRAVEHAKPEDDE